MNGVCFIQIFQLDFFLSAAAVRFGVFIRLNFDSISDHGRPCALVYASVSMYMCMSERAPAWNDHFLPFGGKKIVHIVDIGASESNRTLHIVSHSLAYTRLWVSDCAYNKWNRSCVYVFSSFCTYFPPSVICYSFRQFSIELLLLIEQNSVRLLVRSLAELGLSRRMKLWNEVRPMNFIQ